MLNFIKKIQGKGTGQQGESLPQGNGRAWDGQESPAKPEVSRKILVVGKGETLDAAAIDYAINLAERLGYDLVALHVNPTLGQKGRLFSPYKHHLRWKFTQKAKVAGEALQRKVALKGINFEQLVKFGEVGKAVAEVNRQIKRIEFVITQDGVKETEVNGVVTVPVFSISGYQGERTMARESDSRGIGPIGKTVGFGIAAAAIYAAVFWNVDTVMHYCTKGAWYAALPIGMVFAVSFVHGAFASYLWEALGIQAPKRVQPRPTAAKRPVARKRPRPELRIDT